MTTNISNGLAALSSLTGLDYTAYATTATSPTDVQTNAARRAKALFTAPVITPPWKQAASKAPLSTQLSAIKAMKTIVDPTTGTNALPADIQSDFTTYKALDRLRQLASAASSSTISSTERNSLQATFAKGLGDLQTFMATAPADKLHLAFAQPTSNAQSVSVVKESSLSGTAISGLGIAEARDAPLALTGNEQFRITLTKSGITDTVVVDLATSAQPPTLDSVADAMTQAVKAVPLRNPDGSVALDDQGNPVPRWLVHFLPDKSSGKWGLSIDRSPTEQVAIDQVGASDALMVVAGVSKPGTATTAHIVRFDDPAGALDQTSLGSIAATDRAATASAALLPAPASSAKTTVVAPTAAATSANAIAVDAQGFSYIVGTTRGDLGANRSAGNDDLFLSKRDSEGNVVWQRSLGATGTAQGAAVSLAPDGSIVVAGTVSGSFDGASSDGDMLVARYDVNGDQKFTTLVRAAGADTGNAVAVGQDGSIYVGGQSAAGGDAFIVRLDDQGRLQERRSIDSGGADRVTALAIDTDGQLLVLTHEGAGAKLHRLDAAQLSTELGSIDLGVADARVMAVAADGSIAIGGSTLYALPGSQVNAPGGGRDGFVTRLGADLAGADTTYFATTGDDQVDSLAFQGSDLFVGGRTTGALDGAPRGTIDGFVGRLDVATGAVRTIRQFGQAASQTEAVHVAVAGGGDTALGALGLHRGTITPTDSTNLIAQTSLRAGDEFSIRVNDGAVRKFVIGANDTLTTLSDRIRLATGSKGVVTLPFVGATNTLKIAAKAGNSIELIAGAAGKDALAKLGLAPQRVSLPPMITGPRSLVTPGGSYGLNLTTDLRIDTPQQAAVALARIKQAISISQTGFRSLYWDSSKALLANGGSGARTDAAAVSRANSQTAQYQAALNRLTAGSASTTATSGSVLTLYGL